MLNKTKKNSAKVHARFTKVCLVKIDDYPCCLLIDDPINERYKANPLDMETNMVVLELFVIPLLNNK